MFFLIILPLYCQLGWGQKWDNNFLTLRSSRNLYLSNCLVCGGPGRSENWPWVASPVKPKWWVSALSVDHNGIGFWGEEGSPWWLHSSEKGIYCLNKAGSIHMGESICDWTLSLGLDCWTPNCSPYDCSRYQGRWNQTHVKLTNGSWVRCSFHKYQKDFEGCKAVEKDKFFDPLFLSCP